MRCPVCHIPLDAELASHNAHSQASDPLIDEPLLRYYAQEWDRYTTGANYVNRLFTYLNRHWVKREKDEGRKNVYAVYIVRCLPLPQHPR
jgi:cullin 1